MEIRNNTNIARPSFQANVEQALVNKVRSDAAKVSNETLNRINSQFGFIRNWGERIFNYFSF